MVNLQRIGDSECSSLNGTPLAHQYPEGLGIFDEDGKEPEVLNDLRKYCSPDTTGQMHT